MSDTVPISNQHQHQSYQLTYQKVALLNETIHTTKIPNQKIHGGERQRRKPEEKARGETQRRKTEEEDKEDEQMRTHKGGR